jgi:hypothetical protein
MVERLHRCLKDALPAHGATTTWAAELPWVLLGLRSTPREDTNISPAQPLSGTPLVLPNQYLSINNEQTKNEFIIQIDKILNNLPMTRHNTEADKELPVDLPRELWAVDRVWVRQAATHRPSRPSTTAPMPSSSTDSATSSSSWATGRTSSPPPASSPAPAVPPSPWWRHPSTAGPAGNRPPRRQVRPLQPHAHTTTSGS